MTKRNILEKGNWLHNFFYTAPRTPLEFLHQSMASAAEAKCSFIEPLFNNGNWEGQYLDLAQEISRFFPSTLVTQEPEILIEDVKSGSDASKVRKNSFFHNDNFSVGKNYRLNLMVCLEPSPFGGENEYLTATDLIDALRIQNPSLLCDLNSIGVHPEFGDEEFFPASGHGFRWNFGKIQKLLHDESLIEIVTHLHTELEDKLDLSEYLVSAPRHAGSATLWWDDELLHRRRPEAEKGIRHYKLFRIAVRPPFEFEANKKPRVESKITVSSLASQLISWKKGKPILVVGVDGRNASGKSTLARALATEIESQGLRSTVLGMDSFHHSTEYRYGEPGPNSFYDYYFDTRKLVDEVLDPFLKGHHVHCVHRGIYDSEDRLVFSGQKEGTDILIVEGVFIQKNEISAYLDEVIYVDSNIHDMISAGSNRWKQSMGILAILDRFLTRYHLAQCRYEKEFNPKTNASVVVYRDDSKYYTRQS